MQNTSLKVWKPESPVLHINSAAYICISLLKWGVLWCRFPLDPALSPVFISATNHPNYPLSEVTGTWTLIWQLSITSSCYNRFRIYSVFFLEIVCLSKGYEASSLSVEVLFRFPSFSLVLYSSGDWSWPINLRCWPAPPFAWQKKIFEMLCVKKVQARARCKRFNLQSCLSADIKLLCSWKNPLKTITAACSSI